MTKKSDILKNIGNFSEIESFSYSTVYNSLYENVKYIEINSLEEYISYVTKAIDSYHKLSFRGEADFYEKTEASAFRKKFVSSTPDFLKKEYFKEIGHTLNSIERENFIAYAQHHGLPTELLDITGSPLYALFFACSEESMSNIGVVHVINIEQTINFSDLVVSESELKFDQSINLAELAYNYYIKENFEKNPFLKIVPDFLSENPNYSRYLLGELAVYINDIQKFCSVRVKEQLKIREKEILSSLSELEDEYPKYESLAEFGRKIVSVVKELQDDQTLKFENIITFNDYKFNADLIRVYLELFGLACSLFELILNDLSFGDTENKIFSGINLKKNVAFKKFVEKNSIPPFPLVRYSSSVKFDRIKTQEGEFIYQCYYVCKVMTFIDGEEIKKDTEMFLCPQTIKPNIRLIIMDKSKILRQLDFMGINRKLIYPDSDNIAKYLRDKYI